MIEKCGRNHSRKRWNNTLTFALISQHKKIYELDGRCENLIVEILRQHPAVIFDAPHKNILFPCGIHPISSLKFVSNIENSKVKQTAL
jgi:hypothetical protein